MSREELSRKSQPSSPSVSGRKVLVLAPHLCYPLRNGGDILIERKWSLYSKFVDQVDILSMCVHRSYINGELYREEPFNNNTRSRMSAALRTMLGCSHYLLQKNMTPEYCERAISLVSSGQYDTLVCSLITTAWPLLDSGAVLPARRIIETQNDEIKWYRGIRLQSKSLPEKLVAFLSERWLRHKLSLFSGWLLIHVSEEDEIGYNEVLATHRNIVVPVGTDVEKIELSASTLCKDENVVLLFSGSLSNNMNRDALANFESRFFVPLKEKLGERLAIVVAGSNPSEDVYLRCARNNWQLKPDLTDIELKHEYLKATCSILPFGYSSGGKLKLFKSLAYGIPFLATTKVGSPLYGLPDICLYSDDPNMWVEAVENLSVSGVPLATRQKLVEIASQYSWDTLALTMAHKIEAQFGSAEISTGSSQGAC